MWLSYKDGEVDVFHPNFETIGRQVLLNLGIHTTHHWEHHPSTAGVGVVPDFVLVETASGRWVLIVEIKRTPDAVTSERHQIQTKGYAEANSTLFKVGKPVYFAISNLEITQLYALRGDLPPRDCLVEGMSFDSGRFSQTLEIDHKASFTSDIAALVSFSINTTTPTFSTVWPNVVRTLYQHAESLPFYTSMDTSSGRLPDVVRNYFAANHDFVSRSEMLIRCLLAEYVRGLLRRHRHVKQGELRPIGNTLASVANAMGALRRIDFTGVIEGAAGTLYLAFEKNTKVRGLIHAYLASLMEHRIDNYAAERNDTPMLPDLLIQGARRTSSRDTHGKAATDPELASLLAYFAIDNERQVVLDPGCGEGSLLSAAYDRLKDFGATHSEALGRLVGIEADTLSARIAALRLSLKEPKLISASDPCFIGVADMFGVAGTIANADVILMNPPFKRYEAQDDGAIPAALRQHMVTAVETIDGTCAVATGQWNVLSIYAEFVIKTAREGATLGFILDNKWFHNAASEPLRQLLLNSCRLLAVVTYPHGRFFEGVMIATSMIIMVKGFAPNDAEVAFVRVDDPTSTDAAAAHSAIRGGPLPNGWSGTKVLQSEINSGSWKRHFVIGLANEFRKAPLVQLPALFAFSRRGSLAKEGGGIAVFEFPIDRTNYGPSRRHRPNGSRFQTTAGAPLSPKQNEIIRDLSLRIPRSYLGYAINKADAVRGYFLSERDVTVDLTIELPEQRKSPYVALYSQSRRVPWSPDLDSLVQNISRSPELSAYVESIESNVGLDNTVLPDEQRWNVLREPYAGELIIPRKLRNKHHVHINPFAFETGRQVRLSSNFLSYGHCVATDDSTGLTARLATTIIAAWLVSSFGHVQFELESNNREGVRTIEQTDADRIWVIDPRHVSINGRQRIIDAFGALPFSIRTDLHATNQPELFALDQVFAEELVTLIPDFDQRDGLSEIHELLFDLHEARRL